MRVSVALSPMPNTSKSALKRQLFLYRLGHLVEVNGVSRTAIATRFHRLHRLPSGYRIVIGYNPGMRTKEMLEIRPDSIICRRGEIKSYYIRLAQVGLHEVPMNNGDALLEAFLLYLFGDSLGQVFRNLDTDRLHFVALSRCNHNSAVSAA